MRLAVVYGAVLLIVGAAVAQAYRMGVDDCRARRLAAACVPTTNCRSAP